MKRLSIISILLTLIFCLYSCEEPIVNVSSITLNSTGLDLTEGDSFKLTATVSPDNATDKSVVWSSSNASIASVEDGVVTAVKEGSATITVASKDGGARATCEVTVSARVIEVESVTLSQKEATITVGSSMTLTATVLPENATDKSVTWTSNNTSVATVVNGEVKAVGVGSASITATAGGKNATCTITVKEAVIEVSSVTLNQTSYSLWEGETFNLTATVKPDDATDKTVTWKSSNENVLTVYGGKVTAVKAGTATVTATAGDKSATCEVEVKAKVAVTSVTLDRNKLTIDVGSSETLTATVLPDNAYDKTVYWASSDSDIASVKNGTVKGISEGQATITATAGDKTASCVVTVKFVELQDISLSHTELTLDPGQYENLVVTFYPENATDKTVVWTTSDEAVAKVSSNGRVTAVKAGTATITATAGELKATCFVTVNNTNYLTITNTSNSYGEITIKSSGLAIPTINLKYSADDGRSWKEVSGAKGSENITITLPANGSVRLYGDNPTFGKHSSSSTGYWTITANVPHTLSGDIMSLCSYATSMQSEYQFYRLFYGDTKLQEADKLQMNAAVLTSHCYDAMFQGCTALKKAPNVKATSLASWCCRSMFEKCTSLQEPPALPATTMTKADYCYIYMFKGCTSLTKTPKLPATTLAPYCYKEMFSGCTALKEASPLPAEVLASHCYSSMFADCSALTKAPEIKAKSLANMCCELMFSNCSSMTTPSAIPATELESGCYFAMYKGCSSLKSAPALPAKVLASYCYYSMFADCQSLTSAPALPAVALASYCYNSMFFNCGSLKNAPELPAKKLKAFCYQKMFYNCRSINAITCLATDISAEDCLAEWLFYVADEGTFTKSPDIQVEGGENNEETKQTWPIGISGIPLHWTIKNYKDN